MAESESASRSSKGSSVRKRPGLLKVKVKDNTYNFPLKDPSQEIGSFCNRIIKKLVGVNLIKVHSVWGRYAAFNCRM